MTESVDHPRVLVMTRSFPPQISGSATLMENLLRHFPRESFFVLMGRLKPEDPSCDIWPNVERIDFPEWWGKLPYRPRIPLEYALAPFVFFRALKLVREKKIDRVLACFPFGNWMIAAYWLARRTRLPLYVYMHDLWEENKFGWVDLPVARHYERRIFKLARKVYSITEFADDFYRKKYGGETEVLWHSTKMEEKTTAGPWKAKNGSGKTTVAFSGAVYYLNADAVKAFHDAIAALKGRKIRFALYTQSSLEVLKAAGLTGDFVERRMVPRRELIGELAKADVLYLPLAFNGARADEIHTVFPTKTTEYLLAWSPVLVHVPEGCYMERYAREKKFARVVTSLDRAELARALEEMLDDADSASRMAQNALAAAAERDSRRISAKLQRSLFGEDWKVPAELEVGG